MSSAKSPILAGLLALASGAAGLTGCSSAAPGADAANGPTVVTSTTQTEDFARQILGDRGKVVGLLRPNQSPHHHETTPADITNLANADVVVNGGAGSVDSWLPDAVRSSGFSGNQVDAAAGARLRQRVKDGKVEDDPHLWHDPGNAKIMVRNIATAIENQDPQNKDLYEKNTNAYLARLDELENETRAAIDTIPREQRKLVTTHGAFGYYSDRYGMDFVGSVIPSFDDQAEQSSKQVDDFVQRLRQTGAKAIFTEATIPADVVHAVGDEAHVKIVSDPLYSDNNGPGLDYIATERHNSQVITSNLR